MVCESLHVCVSIQVAIMLVKQAALSKGSNSKQYGK